MEMSARCAKGPVCVWRGVWKDAALAVLKDRSSCSGTAFPVQSELADRPVDAETEIEDLRRALYESRQRLRRSAWEGARQIHRLNDEVSRLQALCSAYEKRLECYASGAALIELGQALMRWGDRGAGAAAPAHRLLLLEQAIEAARSECLRLVQERDALAGELRRWRMNPCAE